MAQVDPKVIVSYNSDLGRQFQNVGFKIKAGLDDCFLEQYGDPPDVLCAESNYFSMRHLVARFATGDRAGATIKFPVASPQPTAITAAVQQLRDCGAQCIDYVGEKWNVIPPGIGGYTPGTTAVALIEGAFADKRSGVIAYGSDVMGVGQRIKIRYEIDPTLLTDSFELCHGNLEELNLCIAQQTKPRAIIAKGAVLNDDNPNAVFSRRAPVYDLQEVPGCMAVVGNLDIVQCLGYEGESMKRIDLALGL